MQNPFDEIERALGEARALNSAIDAQANSIARLLVGHLRKVGDYTLKQLKNELRHYNMHTGRWKGPR
jgi:hypothetical protein